jgi:putative MFS transporter
MSTKVSSNLLNATVIVAALGYFVDVYDLILFGMVRISSLQELGLSGKDIDIIGLKLHNWQMWGMMLGGIFWGVLGDKKGRLSVLFASILTYSVANIANGMVQSIDAYAFWRFIAGFGLAGELGVGITLVAESMSKEQRGYGTMLVASIGVTGAVVAAILSKLVDWRMVYYIGGGLGLMLLLLRISVMESTIFESVKNDESIQKGNFFHLFSNRKIFFKYLKCILIGVPIWYTIGFLILYASRFTKLTHISSTIEIDQPMIIMVYYMGLTIGDLLSGVVSQLLKSRLKAVFIFIAMTFVGCLIYLFAPIHSQFLFYVICFSLGLACGYWAIFITIAAEQFGTNIRSTVANTVPNFVRGALVLLSFLLSGFISLIGNEFISLLLVGVVVFGIALLSLFNLEETFNKDLDYTE